MENMKSIVDGHSADKFLLNFTGFRPLLDSFTKVYLPAMLGQNSLNEVLLERILFGTKAMFDLEVSCHRLCCS